MKQFDVFLSWTGQDRDLKDRIRSKLEANGFSCYDSDRDCKGDYTVDFAINEESSKVYLLILTPALLRSPFNEQDARFSLVRKELRYASDLEAGGKINFVIVSTFNLQDSDEFVDKFYKSHTTCFNKIFVDLEHDDLDSKLEDCKRQVEEYVTARNTGNPIASCQQILPIVRKRIIEYSEHFSGRNEELKQLEEIFEEKNQIGIISGIGGIGKTELAKRFVSESKYICPQIISFPDNEEATIDHLLVHITYNSSIFNQVHNFADSEQKKLFLISKLSCLDENTILILDNVNKLTPKFIRDLRENFTCKFIITTRIVQKEYTAIDATKTITANALPLEKILEVFESIYGVIGCPISDFQDHIYEPLSGNTQAIIMIAHLLHEQGIDLPSFFAETEKVLKNNLFTHELHGEETFDTVSRTLARLFNIDFFEHYEGDKKDILRIMTIIENIGIRENELKKMLHLTTSNDIIELCRNGYMVRYINDHEYYLSMHSIISQAIVLNGIMPTDHQKKLLIDYLEQNIDTIKLLNANEVRSFAETLKKVMPKQENTSQTEPKDITLDSNQIVPADLLDVLLDEENCSPIYMYNEKGEPICFEQIAVIPHDDDLFCLLKPLSKIDGIKDDEAIVFKVEENEDGNGALRVCEDEELAITIMKKYYSLFLEQLKNKPSN